MTVDTPSVAEMFGDIVESQSQTEMLIEQSRFRALQGLWAIRSDFDRDPKEAFDFFLGAILGMAMLAAKLEYETDEEIRCRCQYYAEEFGGLDDFGNMVNPPAEGDGLVY